MISLIAGWVFVWRTEKLVEEQCADTDSVSLIQPNQGQITKLKSVHITISGEGGLVNV